MRAPHTCCLRLQAAEANVCLQLAQICHPVPPHTFEQLKAQEALVNTAMQQQEAEKLRAENKELNRRYAEVQQAVLAHVLAALAAAFFGLE